jgi:hypothetical protein
MASIDGHEYVEIGGVKWATMNIGASSIIDPGLYFQWGDTAGYTSGQCGSNSTSYKKPFAWGDYKFCNTTGTTSPGTTGFSKYNSTDKESKPILDECDDMVRANWGCNWRMPTTDEFAALGAATTSAWTQVNGVSGMMLTDKTDSTKTLFFPAAGYCINGSFSNGGSYGRYWSSSLNSSSVQDAYYLYFRNGGVNWQGSSGRCFGFSVRGVVGE